MTMARLWGDKPYYSLNHYLKHTYGEKVHKIALNGGMSCPNRDGTAGNGGCIFCSAGGSGEFASDAALPVTQQIEEGKRLLSSKRNRQCTSYIAYFQAYTNTYAPVDYLRRIFTEAISHPDIVGLSIATRPDCLPPETVSLLHELSLQKPVWIELGLQTMHERTAAFINRGYPLACFESAMKRLREAGLPVIVHLILGLPGESQSDVLRTIQYLNTIGIHGVKLQLLHVLKGTGLAQLYEAGAFTPLTQEAYTDTIISCLEHLSGRTVIHRLTGDGPRALLLAPMWSMDKRRVLNGIHKELQVRGTWQGRLFQE